MERLRFIVSLITDDNDYQRQQATAAQEAATRLGVDVETVFARNDPIHQSQQLLDIIQTRDAGSMASWWNLPVEPHSPKLLRQRWQRASREWRSNARPSTCHNFAPRTLSRHLL